MHLTPEKGDGSSTGLNPGRTPISSSSSLDLGAPDRTGPQIFLPGPVASFLCGRSAIIKGEEAMAVRGQKMLKDPFLSKRKNITSVGGGGIELFFSMFLASAGADCYSQHGISD